MSDYAYICPGLCQAALTRPRNCGNPRCNMVTKPLQQVPVVYVCPGTNACNLDNGESPVPTICTTHGCKNFRNCRHAMAVVPGTMRISTLDPPENSRTYSSVYGNNEIGTGHARSMITSQHGWSAKVNDMNQWMHLDAGSVVDSIDGLMVANRGDKQWSEVVTEIAVDYATVDGDDTQRWNRVGTFDTCLIDGHGISWVLFSPPILARFVRIRPLSWRKQISLRCCLLLGGRAAAEHSEVAGVELRKIIDVNQLPAQVTLTSIPGGLPPAVEMEGGGYLGVIHSPKGDHSWAGRRIAWAVEHFNNVPNTQGHRVFPVLPGAECSISVSYSTRWSYNQNDYCPGCVVQLYYGLCSIFCTGVVESGIRNQRGTHTTKFMAPVDPGLYYITQSISLMYNYVDNIGAHHNRPESAFAAIRVLPTTFEESIYPILPQQSKDQIISLLCLSNRRGEDSNAFSSIPRYILYEIFSFLMGGV